MVKTQTDLHWNWTAIQQIFTPLQYRVVNNFATDKLLVAVVLGIYINYTSHSQLIGTFNYILWM